MRDSAASAAHAALAVFLGGVALGVAMMGAVVPKGGRPSSEASRAEARGR